ncbi:plasmid replication DNA-binding protein [Acinetobacter lwoffii]|uniref:Helix-turn-helix domain-containing protein n=3 Tax=Acinetobacter lwoffii TaxID=28090 RepID=A0ABN0PTH1_ACILW|nr:plasmid replication DNA-binding protein [Acinetobacter lwoffii]ESJ93653.1 hypothetical protein P800_03327 [Acinetobacter lwoffii NCTC 5866 = CIP 64.10 = NIPH 512]QXB42235.1 plasmid replication DNA-binding protein [Acinetobacter lwoffii]GEA65821.1 hypothetical protein AL1T_30990 [Acinetobacter lwoffii]
MTMLNLTEVSKQFNLNRSTIYRAVNSGKLSRKSDGSFDLAEVIRCFGEPKLTANPKPAASSEILNNELQIALIKKEFEEFRKRAEAEIRELREDKEFLQGHLKQVTHLLEMKTQFSPGETLQQYSNETLSNTENTFKNKEALLQPHYNATEEKTPATVRRQSLFSRVIRAVLE